MIRDLLRRWVPPWLSDRASQGLTVGWRVLWSGAALADALVEHADQAHDAKLPGIGSPTALGLIGEDRAIFRGRTDTDEAYALKLRQWIERWSAAGQAYGLARELQDYLGPVSGSTELYTVRVWNRAGTVVTRDAAGNTSRIEPGASSWTWDWDSQSHPERSGWWSDLWVVVTPIPWDLVTHWQSSTTAWGLRAPQSEVSAVREIGATWKGAHSFLRAVLFAPTEHDGVPVLDPMNPAAAGRPNGWWGAWSRNVGGVRVPARPAWIRFLENHLDA